MAFDRFKAKTIDGSIGVFTRRPVEREMADEQYAAMLKDGDKGTQAYHVDEDGIRVGTGYNSKLSQRLTMALRKLNPELSDVCVLVSRCHHSLSEGHSPAAVRDREHDFNMFANVPAGYSNVLQMFCEDGARMAIRILEDDGLKEFRPSLEFGVFHELGHYKFAALSRSENATITQRTPEYFADLYALSKSVKPVQAIAGLIALTTYGRRADSEGIFWNKPYMRPMVDSSEEERIARAGVKELRTMAVLRAIHTSSPGSGRQFIGEDGLDRIASEADRMLKELVSAGLWRSIAKEQDTGPAPRT